MTISKQDCLNGLSKAADELGHSPSQPEYDKLDISPSSRTIKRKFESWNKAKKQAGLETFDKKRGLPVDEKYFKSIDDSETAYWLGFLYGDGSAYLSEYNSIKIQLQISAVDEDHVKQYKNDIGSGHKLNNWTQNGNEKVGLTVTNKEFADNLANHGFKPGKTTSAELPDLSTKKIQRAFICGLSDADGHVGLRQWTIVGSNKKRFEKLSEWIPYDTYVYERERRNRGGNFVLTLNGVDVLPDFYSWLYPEGDEHPTLERKQQQINAHNY